MFLGQTQQICDSKWLDLAVLEHKDPDYDRWSKKIMGYDARSHKFRIRASLEPEHSNEIIVIDKNYSHS
jgi:hypothetical protein